MYGVVTRSAALSPAVCPADRPVVQFGTLYWASLISADVCSFSLFPAGLGGARGFTFHRFCWHCADLEWESEYFFRDRRHPPTPHPTVGRSLPPHVSFYLPPPSLHAPSRICLSVCMISCKYVSSFCPEWWRADDNFCQRHGAAWLLIREFHGSHKPSQTSKPAAYVAGVEEWLYDVRLLWRRKKTSLQEGQRAMNENMAPSKRIWVSAGSWRALDTLQFPPWVIAKDTEMQICIWPCLIQVMDFNQGVSCSNHFKVKLLLPFRVMGGCTEKWSERSAMNLSLHE